MAAAKKTQNLFVWILMGLLVLGLAGFGVDGFLSQRVTAIGTVGGRDITVQTYQRALQDAMRRAEQAERQPMPLSRALAEGLDTRVRAELVTLAALEAEADRIGISVGDANVMRTISATPAFQGPGGSFDRDTYRFQLQNAGLTPARFEEDVRREAARGILQAASAAGVAVPGNLSDAILAYFATPRDVSIFALDESALPAPLPDPSPEAVAAFHQDNIARFTAPEIRHLTYAWVTPSMVLDQVPVDEGALRALYDSRAADFRQPERRLVERLVFPDQAAAEAAMADLAAGASFEDLVAARGLALDDTDLGDVTELQLGAAGAAVFALTDPGQVTGPHRSPVGPAIFRMNAILLAQETPFEDVADELREELAGDAARRMIADAIDGIEDLLAGGATLEDLAAETMLELGTIDWFPGVSDGIAAYAEFRDAARTVTDRDFPEARALSDGGIFALRRDGVTPPTPRPLDDVRPEAEAGARLSALDAALTARATELAAQLAAQDVETFSEATGLVAEGFAALTRLDGLPHLPPALTDAIHAADPGETTLFAGGGRAWLALVTATAAPDTGDAQTARLVQAIDSEIGAALQQDVFGYFARALEREAGFTFNQNAIETVHAAFR